MLFWDSPTGQTKKQILLKIKWQLKCFLSRQNFAHFGEKKENIFINWIICTHLHIKMASFLNLNHIC
ncbi:hypothetical protein A2331_02545 [Candidatus Falkowbacteria bacterium RIFOXYB2_FULL_34_18]|uniref:Uncharacterized protein n=1 Tax=Candidatus Falkowbacteria bacterium RIFOXYD2_FULL_34_120 TaxID=1798007 RepID=A0A1F5TR56_9BACT|nr:MAG: hypothetical protein A2331_02545 [Candidatus Falkowbacteria bacterium RIFOXYB2_FULL_34_18]OGF29499.1 MAG: hypothetical protein A2500_04395 [Candidatus Falkowbacteria bacterium RIFOXYC12_FULL_34_55]OGF36316.1 MAG: hypothetical protein A2466_05405 [Candidatus Falkowbacteria bacterium RIFOXYC2_FULL_34_220]OGF39025.1 MAG: hypothetical protein A2515_06860 [Candidatus Falkowbacteria bacterium RIFOXYD12_FULL_34_57]OGF41244.1 MAG: hypothetical protein A2531_01100 [Candidatus Falkowbacteria bact